MRESNFASMWARSSRRKPCVSALEEVRHGVEPQAVHAQLEPEVHRLQHRLAHRAVLEVQVGLVREEAVPVVGLGDGIPCPVGGLEVAEDDAGLGVALRVVVPDVEVARGAAPLRAPRALEPGVLVGGVVQHELRHDLETAAVRLAQEGPEVAQRSVVGVDLGVVRDVVAVVAQRRGVEGQQPERVDAEVLQVVELRRQAAQVADPVAVAVVEGGDAELVEDRVLVPVARRAHAPRRGGSTRSTWPTRTAGSSRT
jgi:hypothetical protein